MRGTGRIAIRGMGRALRRTGPQVVLVILAIRVAGCAAPGPAGVIPFGEWSGRGSFVYEDWEENENTAPEDRSIQRSYSTSLSIRPGELEGREVVELEIISERGSLPELGEKTCLRAALVEAKRVSDSTVLYRMVGSLLNPNPDEKLEFDDDAPSLAASCTTSGGVTVLQIHYMDNFIDTFRFAGRRVEKMGVYFNTDGGLIHWWERLTKRP